jgi:F-box and WD-40 domain protein 1/11
MKRTASQTFATTHYHDVKDSGMALDAVSEGSMDVDCGSCIGSSQHSHSNSLSRAFGVMTGQFTRQKSRRRLSSFSSATSAAPRRRGSIASFVESLPSSHTSRCPHHNEAQSLRTPLPHQDSGMQPFHVQPQGTKPFSFKRFSSMRRRPTNPVPPEDVSSMGASFSSLTYTVAPPVVPGAAARQAAAAANQDRQNQIRREQEQEQHTTRFLHHGLLSDSTHRLDDDFKDNESGVDMTCASEMVRADSATEKKMSMCNPLLQKSETIVLTCAR